MIDAADNPVYIELTADGWQGIRQQHIDYHEINIRSESAFTTTD